MGLGETPLVAFDESIKQPVTILFPGTLTSREIDRAQEPHDIDHGRASSGVVEVIESPCILRYRELFDMRVAVQPHNRQFLQVPPERITDTRDPGAVDESKIIKRVSSESLDQLGRRAFERSRLGSERLPPVRCSGQADGNHREHIDEAAGLSKSMHAVRFFLAHDARA